MSKEFSRTENRIIGALAYLDDFLMNPLLQGHSDTAPVTSRNAFHTSQGTNEDDSQSDPHPEAGIFNKQTTQNSRSEDSHAMVAGVRKESLYGHDMVTGATEQISNRHDMVTGVHEEVAYCSPSKSSGKQKKNRSTIQPQFRIENTPATIEADQVLLALQQLANNNNSANFHCNINRISKLPKALTTTMPTFDGKCEKLELFEDLFRMSLKLHNQLTQNDKINYFHSIMRRDALQIFKNNNGPKRGNLRESLAVFRRKDVKHQSMATAKHKFQKLVFNPANRRLVDFLEEFQRLAKDAFRFAAHAIIEQFIYAKMPPHLKKSMNQAHLRNGTYEQTVTRLEKELDLKGLESPDELQINTVSHDAKNTNADRPKPTRHQCKKPGRYRNQPPAKKAKEESEGTQNNLGNKSSGANTSLINNNTNMNKNNNPYKNSNRAKRKPKAIHPPCETYGKTHHSTEKCYYGANAANRPPPRQRRSERHNQVEEKANQNDSDESTQNTAQNLN